MQEIRDAVHVMCVGGSGGRRMDQLALAVNPIMRLHAEMPLIPPSDASPDRMHGPGSWVEDGADLVAPTMEPVETFIPQAAPIATG